MSEYLQKHKQLDAIGGGAYLGLLAGNTPSAANIKAYAQIVKEKSIERQAAEFAKNPLVNAAKLSELADALAMLHLPESYDQIMPLNDFRQQNVPVYEPIIDPIITTSSETIIYAEAGVGKTMFVTDLAYAVACGGHAIKWPVPKPRKVLIWDGEMAKAELVDRYNKLV